MVLRERRVAQVMSVIMMVISLVSATTAPVIAADETLTTPYLQNGSFEDGLTNWTAVQTRVDLGGDGPAGTSVLGGCLSVDTTLIPRPGLGFIFIS